ncbi:ataxin-7-like protein 2b isoform X2 [Archocentrus centrarchus]|uniref:ataxin-7-like protein 2b isoform X2 n=1 Tax=Archocentrus centrarchus TaxID=63155 RepID=UPI0011E9C81E|nr:ataxin-7-like protein 2 isoform X2 [Archocentrus centrarchus]
MAALDRRNPNLDDFVGLNWSFWADRVNVLSSDDMHIYGHCPAHDDFYLVVCSQCGQVVKPQAFERHCERWHGPVMKMRDSSSTLAPQQLICSSLALSNVSSCMERQKEGRCQKGSVSSAASPAHQHRSTKTHKKTVSFSCVRFPGEDPHFLHHSSSMPCLPSLNSAPLPVDNCSSSSLSERPSVQKFTAGQSTESHCPLRGIRTYSRINKNIQKKECELNKQVLDPERKKLCSRELMYNTDSVKHQQEVLGQTKTTDQFSVEQRTTSATDQDTEKLHDKSKHKKKHVEAFGEKMKNKYTNNCHILRSRNPSESSSKEEGNGTVEVEVQLPYPFNQNLPSSDDSEEDEQDEATDLPATPWHPKPLGLCTFGCRTLGCSIFTFDRRLHHLQFALSAMLERHVSTHLWKKMPQVSSGLRSHSLSLESTSVVQFETNPNSYSVKPPYPAISASVGSGRLCFPRKAQLTEVEPMQHASTAQKASKKLQSREDKASRYIRDPSFNEKGQPQQPDSATSSNGKKPGESTETQLSDLKKCRPFPVPNHRSPRSRGKLPGDQQKVVGYDHMSVAQKRKSSSELLS